MRQVADRWWGPVFAAERMARARRWQEYAVRSGFVAVLLVGLLLVWTGQTRRAGTVTVRQMAEVGQAVFFTLNMLQLVAVLALGPAATAGAICLDRTRGMLDHVFLTDLSNREIILGKLAARLVPVGMLLLCAFPVATLASWLGGIDPMALVGSAIVSLAVAWLGGTLALWLSVRASRPQDVLTVVFSLWAVWLLAFPVIDIVGNLGSSMPFALTVTNPFTLTLLPYSDPGRASLVHPALFALGCLAIGAACTVAAVRQVRAAEVSTRTKTPRRRSIRRAIGARLTRLVDRWPEPRGPRLDPDPIFWHEWRRNRPARWSRWVWVGFRAASGMAGIAMILLLLLAPLSGPQLEQPALAVGAMATLGLLLVSTGTAAVLAEERARGDLDVLLCAPVSTRSILRAKWRGAFRPVPRLAVWPLAIGLVGLIRPEFTIARLDIALLVPVAIVTQGAFLVSLGLALATWIKRSGQATAWTIGLYAAAVVGWPIVGIYLPLGDPVELQRRGDFIGMILYWGLAMGSPFFNTALSLVVAHQDRQMQHGDQEGILILLVLWIITDGSLAWLVFEGTVRTFDRCLGRIPAREDRR